MSGSSDFGCNGVKAGTKLNAIEEKLEVIEDQVGLDEEKEEDEVTMRVFGENANSKDPSIDVETDYPSFHGCPMEAKVSKVECNVSNGNCHVYKYLT